MKIKIWRQILISVSYLFNKPLKFVIYELMIRLLSVEKIIELLKAECLLLRWTEMSR